MPEWLDNIFGKGATDMAGVGSALGGVAAATVPVAGMAASAAAAPLALAGGAGGAIGNAIAPSVFGDMNEHGSHTEEVPADGQFKPSTGNQYVDAAVNGVGSAYDAASGAVGAAADWASGLF